MPTFYGKLISENMTSTPEGFLICKSVPIGIEGPLIYEARDYGVNLDELITVYRRREENEDPATLASFEGKPITDGHPMEDVDTTNVNFYQKGHIQNVRPGNMSNGLSCILADLVITDEILIREILNKEKREVSCGYRMKIEEIDGKLIQTEIRGNHLAIVKRGRAGSNVSIRDSVLNNKNNIGGLMTKSSEILQNFINQVQSVKSLDEYNEALENAANELDKVNQVPKQTDSSENNSNPNESTKASLENHVNEDDEFKKTVMQAINDMQTKLNELVAAQSGSPENELEKAINTLSSNDEYNIEEYDKGAESDNAPKQLEEVSSVDSEEEENNDYEIEKSDMKEESKVRDSAKEFLIATRGILSNIKNNEDKKKIVDAAIKVSKKITQSSLSNLIKMERSKALDSSVKKDDNETVQNCYNRMNPHMREKLNLK